jgi:hypothetical protein
MKANSELSRATPYMNLGGRITLNTYIVTEDSEVEPNGKKKTSIETVSEVVEP